MIEMTGAVAFDKAWRIAIKENVFSVDKLSLDYRVFVA